MSFTWSWEDMDYVGEEEPLELPALWVPDGAVCSACGEPQTSEKPLVCQCFICGGFIHYACGEDCNPDAPFSSDLETNWWVCQGCLLDPSEANAPIDVDLFEAGYELL